MRSFKGFIFVLTFGLLRGLSGQDICGDNLGNIPLREAFRWNKDIYLLAENGNNYRIKDFNWDSNSKQFSFGAKDKVSGEWLSGYTHTFAIDYPNKGLRVVAGKQGKVCKQSVFELTFVTNRLSKRLITSTKWWQKYLIWMTREEPRVRRKSI